MWELQDDKLELSTLVETRDVLIANHGYFFVEIRSFQEYGYHIERVCRYGYGSSYRYGSDMDRPVAQGLAVFLIHILVKIRMGPTTYLLNTHSRI